KNERATRRAAPMPRPHHRRQRRRGWGGAVTGLTTADIAGSPLQEPVHGIRHPRNLAPFGDGCRLPGIPAVPSLFHPRDRPPAGVPSPGIIFVPMIAVSDLNKAYGPQTLFEGVSIQFNPGNRYGLVGANGSGKSTFLKILAGEEIAS